MFQWICLLEPPTGLNLVIRHETDLPSCVTPSVITFFKWYSNINEFPISFAVWLRLRGRLTLGGLTFPRKPQVFGVPISYRNYRYSCRHIHFYPVHLDSRLRLHSE